MAASSRNPAAAISALVAMAACTAGCSAGSGTESGPTELTVTVTLDVGITPEVWSLTCEPAGGSHPDPSAACGFLAEAQRAGTDPFAPVAEGTGCTQEYRGPATATVTGLWNGADVDAQYNLTDGCEIARWTEAEPLLGALPAAN